MKTYSIHFTQKFEENRNVLEIVKKKQNKKSEMNGTPSAEVEIQTSLN